jgi:MFS family permease
VAQLGASSAYYVNAASFIALILALLTIPRRPVESAESEEKRRGSILAGLTYVRADDPIRAMVLLMAAMTLFISPFLMITMPFYTHFVLGLGPDGMGWLMAVSGVGSLSGSLGLLAIPRGHRAFAVKLGAAAGTIAIAGMALAPSPWWAAASIILLTCGLSTCYGIANIVIQERAPDELRGRISAVAGLSFFGLIPFSGLLVTSVVDWLGMRQTMGICAFGYGLATTLLLAGRKQLASAPQPVDPPLVLNAEQ